MKRNGFTLIELLLVLAIIGIISVVIFSACSTRSTKPGAVYSALIGKSKADLVGTMGAPDGQVVIDDTTTAFVYSKTDIKTTYSMFNRDGWKTMPVAEKTIFTVRNNRVVAWEVR